MCRVARADPMAIVEPPLPGLDRVADAALSPHEVGDVAPAGPPSAEANVPSARRPVPSAHRGRRPRTPRNAATARSQERFFA